MGERYVQGESDGATARADQAEAVRRLLEIFQEMHTGQRRIEAKVDFLQKMIWEMGSRLFGPQRRALPQVTIAQAKEWGAQWKKVSELFKAFLNPDGPR